MPLAWAALGLVVGAFLDLLVRALVWRREDVAADRCAVCDNPRPDRRLLPLLGALLVQPCSRCDRSRAWRSLAIQVAAALAFAALAWRLPSDRSLLVFSLYAGILLVVFVVDLQHRLIPNALVFPSMLLALVLAALVLGHSPLSGLFRGLVGAFFAGGLFFLLHFLAGLLYRQDDALGAGDVKLAALIGLMTGWPGAMAAILLGSVFGAILGIGVMLRTRSVRSMMPYGTALALGAQASILLQPPP